MFFIGNDESIIGVKDLFCLHVRFLAKSEGRRKACNFKMGLKAICELIETTATSYDEFGNLKKYGKVSCKIDPLNKRLSRAVNGIITNMLSYRIWSLNI